MFKCECGLVILSWKQEDEDRKCPQCNTNCTISTENPTKENEVSKK